MSWLRLTEIDELLRQLVKLSRKNLVALLDFDMNENKPFGAKLSLHSFSPK